MFWPARLGGRRAGAPVAKRRAAATPAQPLLASAGRGHSLCRHASGDAAAHITAATASGDATAAAARATNICAIDRADGATAITGTSSIVGATIAASSTTGAHAYHLIPLTFESSELALAHVTIPCLVARHALNRIVADPEHFIKLALFARSRA